MKYKAQAESNHTMNASSLGMDQDKEKTMRNKISTSKDSQESLLSNVEMDPTELVQDEILSILSNQDRETLVESGHEFNELIFRCSWIGFSCHTG
jgi:hypothetical protein